MRMHLCLLCLAVLLACALSAAPAPAAPSFIGPTGLVNIPNADALANREWNAGLFAVNVDEGRDYTRVVANLGVAEGLEAGISATHPEEGDNETFVNGKYRFAPETPAYPALAVGIIDLTDEVDTTVYVVASKTFTRTITTGFGEITSPRITVGVGGGQFDGLFGGISLVLAQRLALMVEYDTENVNFGARLALTPNLRAHFGAMDEFDDIGVGVSYTRGF